MGADEEGTLAQLKACRRELIDPGIARHRGRIVKTTGDGLLVEFASVAARPPRGKYTLSDARQRKLARYFATINMSFRRRPHGRTRNPSTPATGNWIPGSRLRHAPE
jgi:class 3 adenylate cyclase